MKAVSEGLTDTVRAGVGYRSAVANPFLTDGPWPNGIYTAAGAWDVLSCLLHTK